MWDPSVFDKSPLVGIAVVVVVVDTVVEFPCGCCCWWWLWLWWWKKELNWLSLCSIFRLDSRRCVTLQKKKISIFFKNKIIFCNNNI
jgi:hypothetical protein